MTDKPNPITVWAVVVNAPFKKVISLDLLFFGRGAFIGAGIITAVLIK